MKPTGGDSRSFSTWELGLGGRQSDRQVLILEHGGAIDQQARGLRLGGHVGDHHLDRLVARQGDTELLPLVGVANALIKGGLGDAQRLGGDADASGIQGRQANRQPLAGASEQVVFGHHAVIEPDGGNRVGAHTAKIFQVTHHEPLAAPLGHDHADALAAGRRVGAGKHQADVGNAAVGDKHLVGTCGRQHFCCAA